MRKLTALSLSLFLCLGAFARTDQTYRKAGSVVNEAYSGSSNLEVIDPGARDLFIGATDIEGIYNYSGGLQTLPSKAPFKSPANVQSVKQAEVYAAITYPNTVLGFQKIDLNDGSMTKVANFSQQPEEGQLLPIVMGVANDKIYSVDWLYNASNTLVGAWLSITDMLSGDKQSIDIRDQFAISPQGGCFVADELAFYGFSKSGWTKLDVTTGQCTLLNPSSSLAYSRTLAYDYNHGNMFAIIGAGMQLALVNKETGQMSVILDTKAELYTGYVSGFCYNGESNMLIFNKVDYKANPSVSSMFAIEATTLAISPICELKGFWQTQSMYCPKGDPADPEGPQAPEYISSSFPNGALFGQVSFKLPTLMADEDNTPISGNVEYKVTANEAVVATGTGAPGSTITSNVVLNESGALVFAFTASINGHSSKAIKESIYVGNDVPLAPTNVNLTVSTVTWDPVTAGAHNGFIDTSKMTYTVKINDELVADGIKGTSCATNLPLTAELANYTAEVYAVCNGMTSEPGTSNDIFFGQAYNVPVSIPPTTQQVKLFTIVDNNSDKKTWSYYSATQSFRYEYSSANAADDYLILPPVRINDHEHLYEFSFDAWAVMSMWKEKLEVLVGPSKDVTKMTKIMDPFEVNWAASARKTFSTVFEAPEGGGSMYIAIHAVSPKNVYYVYVNNFNITKSPVSVNGPAAVTDAVAVPGENGALEATVSFKMPTTTFRGAPLSGNVTVEVETLADYKKITGAPGSSQTVKLACLQSTEEDSDPIVITPSQGNQTGEATKLTPWIGIDIPATPQNVYLTANEFCTGGTLHWDKVGDVGIHDGYVIPSEVRYYLVRKSGNEWYLGNLIGTDVDHYDFTLTSTSTVGGLSLGVVAENSAGYNTIFNYGMVTLGDPYPLPAIEDFDGGYASYGGIMYGSLQSSPTMSLGIKKPSSLNSKYEDPAHPYALCGTCRGTGSGYVDLAPFSTKGATKVAIIPNVYVGSCENIRVAAHAYGVEETEIFNLSTLVNVDIEGYQDLVLELPAEFQNKNWVKFRIYAEFSTAKPYLIIGGYQIRNMVPYEITASGISAPAKATAGKDYEISVTAGNYGLQDIPTFTVELYEDGELVDTKTGENLPADTKATVKFTRTMSPIASEPVELYAKVSCPNDAADINNTTATVEVEPKLSNLPGASELQANNNSEGNAVTLTWLEPNLDDVAGEPVTEDFEDAAAFANTYGDWIFADVDKAAVGGLDGMDIPGITLGETKGSFWIWDNTQLGNATFDAHSGTKFLFNMFNYNPAEDGYNNDWAISPELSGTAQTITFWARSYTENYGREQIKVWYSTGSVNPEDFIEIEGVAEDGVPEEWTQYEFEIPAGALRFAINCVSEDKFMLFIDDVTYIPAGVKGDAELLGYDIYRDGVKINNAPVEENDYTDSDVVKGQTYTYIVVALFDKGFAKPSNSATILVKESGISDMTSFRGVTAGKGFIRINGFEGENVVITSVDGKVIASGNAADLDTIDVNAGVYVVKIGRNAVKVIVK